jgi:hypothetical protein
LTLHVRCAGRPVETREREAPAEVDVAEPCGWEGESDIDWEVVDDLVLDGAGEADARRFATGRCPECGGMVVEMQDPGPGAAEGEAAAPGPADQPIHAAMAARLLDGLADTLARGYGPAYPNSRAARAGAAALRRLPEVEAQAWALRRVVGQLVWLPGAAFDGTETAWCRPCGVRRGRPHEVWCVAAKALQGDAGAALLAHHFGLGLTQGGKDR